MNKRKAGTYLSPEDPFVNFSRVGPKQGSARFLMRIYGALYTPTAGLRNSAVTVASAIPERQGIRARRALSEDEARDSAAAC